MIVLSHFSLYGQSYRITVPISYFDLIGIRLYNPFGQVGVYLFVLITGFFLGDRNLNITYGVKKAVQIWMEVIFYTVVIACICIFLKSYYLSFKGLLRVFFPFTFGAYWFVTAYIFLMLLSPFINKLIQNLDKKTIFRINCYSNTRWRDSSYSQKHCCW